MKLLALDVYNVLFRAYHALPTMSTSEGVPTNAIYGIVSMLLKLLQDVEPDYLLCVFDSPGPTYRDEIYPEYKANRPPMEEDIKVQAQMAREVLQAFGIPSVEMTGYEADDVLAAVAQNAEENGMEAVIVSNDRDLLQLVRGPVKVLAANRKLDIEVMYDEGGVAKRLGVPPDKVVELKALMGDASDNIPGVPGVGEKTAAALLQQFDSLENLFERLDEVQRPKLREALGENRANVFARRELVKLRPPEELPVKLDECKVSEIDWAGGASALEKLEFRTLVERIRSQFVSTPAPTQPAAQTRPTSSNELQELLTSVRAGDLVALRANAEDGTLAVGIARGDKSGFWEIGSKSKSDRARSTLSELLARPDLKIIAHDSKSLFKDLRRFGFDCPPAHFDTFLAAYLINPNKQEHPLSELASRFISSGSIGSMGSLTGEAAILLQLKSSLEAELSSRGMLKLLTELETPLAAVLAQMEENGVLLDIPKLQQLSQRFGEELTSLEAQIHELAGRIFNISSTKQLQEVLFGQLGLKGLRRTKTGYSTDVDTLEQLRDQHPVIPLILQQRTYSKLKSTYLDALPACVNPETGRVHTTWNQAGTATGRISSSDPNLQNIPIRSEWGTEIRRCFIAPERWILVSADYSQIDLRVLAHFSQDPILLKAFSTGSDIHTETACALFEVESSEVTAEMRRQAKTVNFGIIYGMGARALGIELGRTTKESEKFIEDYFKKLPKVKEYLESAKEDARQLGYATTVLGRKRPIPEIRSPNHQQRSYGERIATNAPIQGGTADILKLAMLEIKRKILAEFPNVKMTLQVHDELIFEFPTSDGYDASSFATKLREVMENAFPLSVPLKAEVKTGPNWAEMETL